MKYPLLISVIFLASLSQAQTGRPSAPVKNAPAAQVGAAAVPAAHSAQAALPAAPVTSAPPAPAQSAVDSMLNEDLIRSIRDPFQLPAIMLSKKDAPKTDLEVFPLKDFKLNGVITGPKKTRAMVTTPSNKVFFVRVGDRIGIRDGHVSQISTSSIKVLEYYTDEHGKKLPDIYELRISGELISLSKQEQE